MKGETRIRFLGCVLALVLFVVGAVPAWAGFLPQGSNAPDDAKVLRGATPHRHVSDPVRSAKDGVIKEKKAPPFKEGELLVKFRPGVSAEKRQDIHRRNGAEKVREFPALRLEKVKVKKGKSLDEAIKEYAADPAVEYAEPNYRVDVQLTPNDPSFGSLWGMQKINAPEAWNTSTGSTGVVVAVIDTGVDYTHNDLAANMWVNTGEIAGNGIDDDGNGYVDDVYGWNGAANNGNPFDDHGHGTHVAGTIGAIGNNGNGVAGVNWNVRIMALKFLDASGSGSVDDAVECLLYIHAMKARGVNVVASNNSWGGSGYSQSLADAINLDRNVLFMAAAGNSSNDNDAAPFYPAGYRIPNLVAVAATDSNDNLASFSNYGKTSVHVGAPGVGIYSTLPQRNTWGITGGYGSLSGTSMATPHVTGLAALIMAQDPNRTWNQVKNLLMTGGEQTAALQGKCISGRRINALGSLACNNTSFVAVQGLPAFLTPGNPVNLSVYSAVCANAAGPVTVQTALNETIFLKDDGVAPDLAAGDGLFAGVWTPSREAERLTFTSPAGTLAVSVPPLIMGGYMPEGNTRVPYNHFLGVSGGLPPYVWTLQSGQLPPGIEFTDAAGRLSGTPTATGTYAFAVSVTDSLGSSVTRDLTIRVTSDLMAETWAVSKDFGGDEYGRDVAVDAAGNRYVGGSFANPETGNSDAILMKYAADGSPAWIKTYATVHSDYFKSVAVDSNGYVYAHGASYNWNIGVSDWFVQKYDGNGNLLWTRTFDSGREDYAGGVAVDRNGNVLVTGKNGYMGYNDAITVKYDTDGTELWRRSFDSGDDYFFGSWNDRPDYPSGIAVDADGNGIVSMYSANWIEDAYNPGSYGAYYDYVIVKYDPSGNQLWTRRYDSNARYDMSHGVAVDSAGNSVVTGYQEDGSLCNTVKYDAAGNLLWAKSFNDNYYAFCEDVASDASGNVVVTGAQGATYAGYALQTFKYDSAGNVLWKKIGAYGRDDWGYGLNVDASGNVFVAGSTSNGATDDILLLGYSQVDNSLRFTSPAMAFGTAGSAYSEKVPVAGGITPYSFSIVSGNLPAGLSLASNGIIAGTPASAGASTFTLHVADAAGASAEQTFTLNVYEPLRITTNSLPRADVGVYYDVTANASGGLPSYVWYITGGNFPPGLTLDYWTGAITGTPTANGIYTFNLTARDANSTAATTAVSLYVGFDPPLVITTDSLPSGTQGTPYSQYLTAAAGQTPYSWSVSSGSLPPGLSLDASSGLISGTPAAPGDFSFEVMVTDAANATASKSLGISVAPGSGIVGWVTKAPMPTPISRGYSAAVNGKIYILGGTGSVTPDQVQVYNTADDTWAAGYPFSAGGKAPATATVGDTIYLAGGRPTTGPTGIVQYYNTSNGQSQQIGSLQIPRYRMNAAVVNNKMYVVGGYGATGLLNSIEEFDLSTRVSSVKAAMPLPVTQAGVVAVGSKIYILGGGISGGVTGACYEFNPNAQPGSELTPKASLLIPGEVGTAVEYKGKIYVVAVKTADSFNSAIQEYDVANDSWRIVEYIPTPRYATASEVVNGALYVIGGDPGTGVPVGVNEAWGIGSTPPPVVDVTPPTTTAEFSGTMGNNGWYISDVQVTLTATDEQGGSGVNRTEYYIPSQSGSWKSYTAPFTLSAEMVNTGYYRSADKQGNVETDRYLSVPIDKTPPVTSISLSGTTGNNGWFRSDVTVILSASDNYNGSGVAYTEYSFDGISWYSYTAPFTAPVAEGMATIYFRSMDNAGHLEFTKAQTLNIDRTPPTTSATLAGTTGQNGWFTSDVQVTLSAADNASGIANIEYSFDDASWTTYSSPLTISSEGTTTVYARAQDGAGNIGSSSIPQGKVTVLIDKTAPKLLPFMARASVTSGGAEGNSHSRAPLLTKDGRFAAFSSTASNLVTDDTNGMSDVFIHDRATGATERVSVSSSGEQAIYPLNSPHFTDSFLSSVSADGRYVLFSANAYNLAAPFGTLGNKVFLRDRQTNKTEMISVSETGQADNTESAGGAISADGRYVVFGSSSMNIIPGITTYQPRVFVKDRETGAVENISVSSDGADAVGNNMLSYGASISSDGRYVLFLSSAGNLVPGDTNGSQDLFIRDRQLNRTTRVNVASDGTQSAASTIGAFAMSADARYVAFESTAKNLVSGVTLSNYSNTYLHDMETGSTVLVNTSSTGAVNRGWQNSLKSMSPDGRYVAFWSDSVDIVPGAPFLFNSIIVHDAQTGANEVLCSDGCSGSSLSGDSKIAAFATTTPGLVPDDTNAIEDVFVRDSNPAVFSGTPGNSGWYTSNVQVDLTTAGDAGSGVVRREYNLNGAGWTTFTTPFTVSATGVSTLLVRAADAAGNFSSEASSEIRIDPSAVTSWNAVALFGGRIDAIELSPAFTSDRTMFAGGMDTGLYRSTDGGANWSPAGNGFVSASIASIAFSPAFTSDRGVLAGTWGYGLYQSANGGDSWTQVATFPSTAYVYAVKYSPDFQNDGIILAGTYSGLYQSTDYGRNWTLAQTAGFVPSVQDISFSPNFRTDRTVYFSDVNGNGIVRSVDGGNTWIPCARVSATNNQAYGVEAWSDGTVFASAQTGTYRSTDGGQTWVSTGLASVGDFVFSPGYDADGTVFAGQYRSTDFGVTWTKQTGDSTSALAMSPSFTSDGTIFLAGASGVFKSGDRGTAWAFSSNGISKLNVTAIAPSPSFSSDRTIFAAANPGGIYRSRNGGITWQPVNNGLTDNRIVSLVATPSFATDGTLYALSSYGYFFRSTNGGDSWQRISIGSIGYGKVLGVSPNFAVDKTVFAGGEDNLSTYHSLFRSVDGGTTWTRVVNQVTGTVNAIALSPAYASDRTIVLGTAQAVRRSVDGGTTWTSVSIGRAVKSLVFSPEFGSDRTIYAGAASNGVYRSTDGGVTWAQYGDALPTVYALSVTPDKMLIAGTDSGTYRLEPATLQWVPISEGLQGSKVRSLQVSPDYAVDGVVYAGAYLGGLWSRSFATYPLCSIAAPANLSVFNTTTVPVAGTASDGTGSGVALVEVSTDGGATWTTAGGTLSWSYNLTVPADGTYSLVCRAKDIAGNIGGASKPVTVTVDAAAPSITPPAGVTVEALGNQTAVAIGVATATDAVGVVTVTNDAPATFPLGTTTVTWTATDVGGNSATATQTVTVRDTTAPTLTAPANVTAEATGAETAVAIGTATAADAVGVVSLTNNAPATFPVGTTTVIWTATDAAGHSTTATQTVTVQDTTAPALAAPANVTAEATGAETTVAIGTATATDAVGVVTLTNDAPATFPLGTTTVTWTATDAAGHITTATQTVTVQDTTAPALAPPANVTAEATGAETTVAIGTATASDAVGVVSLTNNAPATFPVGTTTVIWTASDAAGHSTTATQTVTVQDTTAPALAAPANVTAEAAGAETTVAIGTATATDAVGVVSLTNDAPAAFPVGTTTVTWTATDAAGHGTTATQTVSVQDTTAPALTAPANVTAEATGAQTAVAVGTATATDAVGVVSLTNDAPATFPVGTTTVTWTATDAAGHGTTATQTVTVSDTKPPVLSGLANQTLEAASASGSVATFNVTAFDLVDGAVAATCAPLSGSTFALGTTVVTCTARDAHNNPITGTFNITVQDTTAPAGTIKINGGAAYTNTTAATLTLSATDAVGVSQMMFSNDAVTWSTAEAYSATKAWNLAAGDGTRTVYVRYGDVGGNWSSATAVSTSILLDTAAPVLVSTDPANDASGVAMDKVLTALFNEKVQAGAAYGGITLKKASTIIAVTTSIANDQLSIAPTAALSKNSKYTLTIPAGALQDMAGNPLTTAQTIFFTTAK